MKHPYRLLAPLLLLLVTGSVAAAENPAVADLRQKLEHEKSSAAQEKLVAPFYDTLPNDPGEKIAFLHLGFNRYVNLINRDVFAPYAAKLIHDTDPKVRATAITALANIGATQYFDQIASFASDQDILVRRAVACAFRLGDNRHVEQLKQWLENDTDPVLRQSSLTSLGSIAARANASDASALILYIIPYLDKPDFKTTALRALANADAKDKAALDNLVRMTRDPKQEVRLAALDAIGSLRATSLAQTVADRLADPDIEVRARAIDTLEFLDAKDHLPDLVRLLDDKRLGSRAADAVLLMGGPAQAESMANLINDADPNVRAAAVMAISRWAPEKYGEGARKLLDDPDPTVRGAVARGIVKLFPTGGSPIAVHMLEDPSAYVRTNALQALSDLHATDQRAAVEALLSRETAGEIKLQAQRLLKDWNPPSR